MKPFAAKRSLDRPRNSTPVAKSCRLRDSFMTAQLYSTDDYHDWLGRLRSTSA
jgi:hypothetical protein